MNIRNVEVAQNCSYILFAMFVLGHSAICALDETSQHFQCRTSPEMADDPFHKTYVVVVLQLGA
jgi:hypothetical protein